MTSIFFFFFYVAELAKKSKSSWSKAGKLAISLGSVVVLFLVMFAIWWAKKKRKGTQFSLLSIFFTIYIYVYTLKEVTKMITSGNFFVFFFFFFQRIYSKLY